MAEKDILIPKECSASLESLDDPPTVKPITSEAQVLTTSGSRSDEVPDICPETSQPGPSRSVPSTSQGTSTQLESSVPTTKASGGSLDEISEIPSSSENAPVKKPLNRFGNFFPSIIKQGTHPSVPIRVVIPKKTRSEIAAGYFKEVFLATYIFVMIVIMCIQAVLIALCCSGLTKAFYLVLLISVSLLLCLAVAFIAVTVVLTIQEIKSGRKVQTVTWKKNVYVQVTQEETDPETEIERTTVDATTDVRRRNIGSAVEITV